MHHHHLLHTDIKNKGLLGLHTLFKVVGSSFVAIFIPAILFSQFGFSLSAIFLFTAIHSVRAFGLQYRVSSSLIARQGTKLSMIIGVVCFMLYMVVLSFGESMPGLIFIAPLLSGAHTAFFWMAFHVSLSQSSAGEKQMGKKVAGLEIIGIAAAMVGPVIGGILTDVFGSPVLFRGAALCILVSLIPLWLDDHDHEPVERSSRTGFTKGDGVGLGDQIKEYLPLIAPFSGLGYVQFVGAIVWSIILYLNFESFTKIGMISSATSIIVMLGVWLMGKWSDDEGSRDMTMMKRAVGIQATTWGAIALALVTSFFSNVVFMMADAFHKLTFKLSVTYLNKQIYEHHLDLDASPTIVAIRKALIHEGGIHCFRAVMCIILAVLSVFITPQQIFFVIPLVLLGCFAPLQLLFPKKSTKNTL